MSHLYLLPIGAYSENTFRFLYSSEMSRLFQRFRDEFDYVLVDTPPCLEFVDSRIMAQYAEGVVLVVRADHTDRRTVQACARLFQGDGARIIGILLNRWKPYRGDV